MTPPVPEAVVFAVTSAPSLMEIVEPDRLMSPPLPEPMVSAVMMPNPEMVRA